MISRFMSYVFFIIFTIGAACMCMSDEITDANKTKAAIIGDLQSLQPFKTTIESSGYQVEMIDPLNMKTDTTLDTDYSLIIIPDSANLPIDSINPIISQLKNGADLIALNTPLWGNSVIKTEEGLTTADEYLQNIQSFKPKHIAVNFTPDSISAWGRGTNNEESKTLHECVNDQPFVGFGALHVEIDDLQGWDTFGSILTDDPFPNGNTLTVFTAKGGPNTSQAYIEWVEKDGSRWVAVFPLYNDWRRYVLTPDDFVYWQSNHARGFKGDKFNPANVSGVAVGLSFSFTGVDPGKHEYWIGPIGTDVMNDTYRQLINSKYAPVADTLSPYYKFFDVTNASSLSVRDDQLAISVSDLPMPKQLRSTHPRPRGVGYDKKKNWRWIPLVESRTKDGKWCGNPVTLMINQSGEYKGGKWASFTIPDLDWYKSPASLQIIKQLADYMKNDVYLIDAGSNHFTYFDDQDIVLGARIANLGKSESKIVMNQKLIDTKSRKTIINKNWNIEILPESLKYISNVVDSEQLTPNDYTAVTELLLNDKTVDIVTHDFTVYQPKAKPNFVKIKDGEFVINGKPWRPNGINYMPSSGIAMEDGIIFGSWLCAKAYDPEVIDRDIHNMKEMGMDAVSIFLFHGDLKDQNLPDILRRLDKQGMKANVSLRPGTPMDFPWLMTKEMIEYSRLKDNDTVFAYDLAWEPMFGSQRDRVQWDGEWEKWVIERYGSIENAEKDWNYPIPRDASGNISNPSPDQISSDGEWRVMMAAYRRFLDTLLYKKYGTARDLVHSIDPNHHVSFRMAEASNPNYSWGENIPYDFAYLSSAVDFLSPEAYGRIGTWERVKPGWFQREYARMLAPDKPMIWAEMGVSTWDNGQRRVSNKLMNHQGECFSAFYKMMQLSGANGIFSWYYPGGYRYDEKSDYGIINPDTSYRPSSIVIRDMKNVYIPDDKENIWFEIDRDKNAIGLAGVYAEFSDEFWAAIDKGLSPRFKTSGMGTTSANCPMLAVGNTQLNGTNPPKYLDAAFDNVEIKNISGEWQKVDKAGTVTVKKGQPIKAKVTIRNLNDAKWLSAKGDGQVVLNISSDNKDKEIDLPADVSRHMTVALDNIVIAEDISDSAEATLSLKALNLTAFGEIFTIKLIAQ